MLVPGRLLVMMLTQSTEMVLLEVRRSGLLMVVELVLPQLLEPHMKEEHSRMSVPRLGKPHMVIRVMMVVQHNRADWELLPQGEYCL